MGGWEREGEKVGKREEWNASTIGRGPTGSTIRCCGVCVRKDEEGRGRVTKMEEEERGHGGGGGRIQPPFT